VIFLILILFGYVIGLAIGEDYMFLILIISIVFSLFYVLIGFYHSSDIALASVGAVRADNKNYRDLYNLVEGLTIASGLPMPKIYIMNSKQINAFASGRNPKESVICVTTGQ
jgi:heat shock protein HtpX